MPAEVRVSDGGKIAGSIAFSIVLVLGVSIGVVCVSAACVVGGLTLLGRSTQATFDEVAREIQEGGTPPEEH